MSCCAFLSPPRNMNDTIKICLVQPVQSPYWTERLKALAQQKDLEVTLLVEQGSFAHRPGWKPEPIDGVRVEVLGSTVLASTRTADDLGYRIQGVRSVPWHLPAALRRLQPDIVVLCNATQVLLALTVQWLFRFRIALIVEDTPHATRNLGWLPRTLRAWAYRRAGRWFAFSDDAKAYLASIGITSGVERSSWSLDMNTFKRDAAQSITPIAGNSFRERSVLFIGQFIPRKGLLLLLKAWASLPAEVRSHARLILIGDGPLQEQAERFCASNGLSDVTFFGQVPYDRVTKMLGTADLFVLPTLEDIYSLVVLEAMASGCPVIITPFAGSRELVEQGRNGWIVDPTEPGALAAALAHAISSEVDLAEMGRAARARVEDMDNVKVMSRFADSLRDLVGGS
jgi:glycosyltransferase involved in cell wall biosynthesis